MGLKTRRGSNELRLLALLLGAGALSPGCGSSVALVPESPPESARVRKPTRVPYPPPPAEIEVLPLRRRDECLWRDGFWTWKGASFRWTNGAWVVPPEGCTYAKPEARWEKNGGVTRLVYYPPEWQPEEPGTKCVEPRACTSLLPESEEKTRDPMKATP